MLCFSSLFETTEIPVDFELTKKLKHPKVKEFVKMSEQIIKNGEDSLTPKEQQKYRGMFDDEAVKDYIKCAAKTGQRDGWLYGGILGSLVGFPLGAISALPLNVSSIGGILSLSLLGAIAGGVTIGFPLSKLLYILRKWKAEDDVVKLGKYGGKIGQTTPIVVVK